MSVKKRKKPSRYHHGDLNRVLLQVAGELLEAEGLEGIKLSKLAELADVSPTAPYNHFEDLNALFITLATQGFLDLELQFEQGFDSIDASDPDEYLRFLYYKFFNFAKKRPNLFDLMFSDQVAPYSTNLELYKASASAFAQVNRFVTAFLDHSSIPSMEPSEARNIAMIGWGFEFGFIKLFMGNWFNLVDNDSLAVEEIHTKITEVFIDTLKTGFNSL